MKKFKEVGKKIIDSINNLCYSTPETRKKWLDDNSKISLMIGPHVSSLRTNMGHFIKLNDLEIFKEIFPEEYAKLCEVNQAILKKLAEHYLEHVKPFEPNPVFTLKDFYNNFGHANDANQSSEENASKNQ